MPVVFKPMVDFDDSQSPNPFNRRGDGFDPTFSYQMIPIGGTREMGVRTGPIKAEMRLTAPNISSMSNFRILQQSSPNLLPLPGPGVPVQRIALPERSLIQFTLAGRALGNTELEGVDRSLPGQTVQSPEIQMRIAVKGPETRKFAVCYMFDRRHQDTGARGAFVSHFAEVNKIYQDQANFLIENIDVASADTRAARTITLNGTCGKSYDLDDKKLKGRVIKAFDSNFPGVVRGFMGL